MSLQTQLFLGLLIDHELNIHLNKSATWKESRITGQSLLKQVHQKEKEYLGYIISSSISVDQIKEKETQLKTELQNYCPKLNLDKHKIYLFSQLLLS